MSDYIGEASVKITGDIKPLEQAVNQAKQLAGKMQQSFKGLEGFKINYDGKQFESFQAYTQEISRQQQEWEAYAAQQREVASATSATAQSVSQLDTAMVQTSQNAQQTQGALSRVATSAANFGRAIEGSLLRTKDSIQEAGRVGRTALIGLGVAMTALAKSSLKEYAQYSEEAQETQERLSNSISRVKASLGSILQPAANVISTFAEWASQNQQVVSGIITAVGVLAGSAGLIALVTKLAKAITALKVTAGGIVGIISVLAGVLVGATMQQQNFSNTTEETNKRLKEEAEISKKLADGYADMTESISDANKQMEEAWDDYRQSLKKVLVEHEDTVKKLNEQIKEANYDYEKSIDERVAEFEKSQAKEEKAHQEKVDELMTQLRFLQRYNNDYNKEKLAAVQFALAREETLHQKQTEKEKAELDLRNEYDKKKRDERISSYEQELATERQFLQKHAQLFASVRETILRDEVENIQKNFNATMSSLNTSVEKAKSKFEELKASITRTLYATYNEFIDINSRIMNETGDEGVRRVAELARSMLWSNGGFGRGYADGGYTGAGGKDEVAGIVHRGEYVLPQEMVDQTTGTPKAMGNNITINLSGTFATSDSERRKVAQQIVAALEQTNYARLGA